jgi:hypothetical protein
MSSNGRIGTGLLGAAALLAGLVFATNLNQKPEFVPVYKVGDVGPAGGLIFYIDEKSDFEGFDYLESSPASCEGEAVAWAIDSQRLGEAIKAVSSWKENSLGLGQKSTDAMLASDETFSDVGTASGYANELDCGGHSDWFVPSRTELDLMYEELAKAGQGNFTDGYYWSSSAYEYGRAWNRPFSVGIAFDGNKDGNFAVRPIRAF